MKKALIGVTAAALIGTLTACGESGEQAGNGAANDMNAMTADAGNPFAHSEMAMDQAISAAIGTNAADTWVRKMIEHHKGAVEMSRVVIGLNPTPDVARMAQQTIDKQTKEIADLEKLVASGNPDPASAELYRPATAQMHDAMMAAKGADISETYLRKMLAHHQGAIAMSDVALANGATGAVRAKAEKTKADQQKEIAMIEAMLRGEPMPAAEGPAPSPATAATPPAASRSVPPKPKPAAAPPKPSAPAPAPAPDPHAGHDMNNM